MVSWMVPHHYPMGFGAMDAYLECSLASSSRQMRNKAEKQRRDKLNNYITELATLVPTVASSAKRLDKTSILRLSANYLRTARCSVLNPTDSADRETGRFHTHLSEVLQNLDGFLLVAHGTGKILYVTENVEKLLGHSQNEMLGHLLFSFTSPDQHSELRRHLTPDGQPTPAPSAASAVSPGGVSGDDSMSSADSASTALSSPPPPSAAPPSAASTTGGASQASLASPAGSGAGAGSPSPAAAAAAGAGEGSTGPQRQRRSFILNLSQRAVSRGDAAHYEPFSVVGYLHVPGRPPPPAARAHGRRPPDPPAPSANDIVLVAVVQQHKERSITDFSIMEATREEYVTRHFKDGRIAYSDHRIAMVAGYLAEEVSGLSAFTFMHKDDVNFTVVALQQMYDLGQGAGGSAYRLMAKTGRYIYLRTQGFLEFNKRSGDVETLICINTLLTEEEGERLLKEMKTRFAASVAKCQQITRTGGPLAKAVSPEYLPPVMPAPERILPSPSHSEDHRFMQSNSASDPALSPVQGASPGSSQFASMAIHSPPTPVQSQASPPVPQYTGVITGPSSTASQLDRPTVLRQTQSVITERVSVLTTAGNPVEAPMDTSDLSDRSRWGYKEVSVLKRAISLDGNGSSSKRLHTGTQPRLRRRDSQPPPSLTEALEVEVSNCPPVLTPEEQQQALARRTQPPAMLPSPAFRGQWPPVQAPSSSSPLPDPSFASPFISPDPLTEHDQSLEDLEHLCDDSFLSNFADPVPLQTLPDPADWPSFADGLGVPSSHAISLTASGVDLDQSSAVVQYSSVEQQLQIQHQVLQTRMKYQETQMNQLEQSLDTVPMSDQTLQNSLSHLKDQHKKQLQMLHTLKQDHHCLQRQDSLGSGPCVKQNLGV